MKRFIFTLAALMLCNMTVQAVDWQPLDTKTPYSNMLIDNDSIRFSDKTKDFFYSVRFTKYPRAEQVVYLKSDFYRDYIGIVRVDDYDYQTYKPRAVYRTSHAFMKPISEVEFLYPAHKYVASIYVNEDEPQSIKKIDKIIGNDKQKYKYTKISQVRSYIKKVDKALKKNWNPPENQITSKIVVNFDINADGTLRDYQIVEPSLDETITRSVINAIELALPFENLSELDMEHIIIQVTFTKGKHSRKVK